MRSHAGKEKENDKQKEEEKEEGGGEGRWVEVLENHVGTTSAPPLPFCLTNNLQIVQNY